jgi:hypothetical protein
VHVARGHYRRAAISAGVHLGFGLSGGALALQLAGCDSLLCDSKHFTTGLIGGFAVAALVDAFTNTDEESPRDTSTAWAPQLTPTRGGAALGLAGTF